MNRAMLKDRRHGDRRREAPTDDAIKFVIATIGIVLALMLFVIYKFNL